MSIPYHVDKVPNIRYLTRYLYVNLKEDVGTVCLRGWSGPSATIWGSKSLRAKHLHRCHTQWWLMMVESTKYRWSSPGRNSSGFMPRLSSRTDKNIHLRCLERWEKPQVWPAIGITEWFLQLLQFRWKKGGENPWHHWEKPMDSATCFRHFWDSLSAHQPFPSRAQALNSGQLQVMSPGYPPEAQTLCGDEWPVPQAKSGSYPSSMDVHVQMHTYNIYIYVSYMYKHTFVRQMTGLCPDQPRS